MKLSIFQTVLLVVFGFAALTGLFVFATHTSNSTNTSSTIGPVLIWGTLPKAGMDAFLATSTTRDQNLKQVSYEQKNPATLAADLASAIATGAGPDLVLASQEQLRSLSKYITPIPPSTLPASTFANGFIKEGDVLSTANGYYGVPFLVDPLVLFSNRTILTSAGVARAPETWEALIGLVPNVAKLTAAHQITRGLIALGTYDNVRNARGILSALFLQQGVPITSYTSGHITADLGQDSSGGQSPGKAVLGFYTQFADPSKVSYTWNSSLPSSDQAFLAEDLALYIGYVSEAKFFAPGNPNLDFVVSPLPQPGTARGKSTYGLLYSFLIPNKAKNASGAYAATILFAGSTAQSAAAQTTGLAPATLTQLSVPQNDPTTAVAYAEALYASGWLSPAPADTDRVFSSMIMDVISGRSAIDAALASGARSLSALFQ